MTPQRFAFTTHVDDGERFAPHAFDAKIGSTVTVKWLDDELPATVTQAIVADDGLSVWIEVALS